MNRRPSRLLSALLCATLLLMIFPISAGALTLTAVNDTLLPLSDSTMPARLGGELYVPYGVFGSLGASSSYADDTLSMSGGGETLTFSLAEGYVYDQNLNSYSTPAYERNSTIYVPVKLVCGKLGYTYSTFTASGETVLRITDGGAQSDSSFANSASGEIDSAVNGYYGNTSPSNPGTSVQPTKPQPDEPEKPPVVEEKPTQKPSLVYLTFFGPTTEHTAATLDVLKNAGRTATFFLPTDTGTWDDDLIRRIVAEGHTPALLLYSTTDTTPDNMATALTAANEKLSFLTGVSTRIVSNADGCGQLTRAQRDRLIAEGYRLWDSTFDTGDAEGTAGDAYSATVQRFTADTASLVVRLRHSKTTPDITAWLCSYMSRQSIPSSRITLTTVPMNAVAETR